MGTVSGVVSGYLVMVIVVFVATAAVADWRPARTQVQKIKKQAGAGGNAPPPLELVENPDILAAVAALPPAQRPWCVGFAAESEHLLAHARAKLERKGLDFLIANDITAPDAGFEVDTNRVVILGADGSQTPLALATKTRIAEAIIERVSGILI